MFAVPMFESERGYGFKTEYAGPFETFEEAKSFQDSFNEAHNNFNIVPDWYILAQDPVKANPSYMKFNY